MSTQLNSTQQSSADQSNAQNKAIDLFEEATAAFQANDLSKTIQQINQIPEALRTKEMQTMLTEAEKQRHIKTQLEIAQKYMKQGQPEMATAAIQKIPESDRDGVCKGIMKRANQSQFQSVIDKSEKKFTACKFEEVVRLLEEIPKIQRPNDAVALLMKTHTLIRHITELRKQLDEAWTIADALCQWESYQPMTGLLNELLENCPDDTELIAQKKKLQKLKRRYQQRDRAVSIAIRCQKNRSYTAAKERLESIDETLRTEEIDDLCDEMDSKEQQVEQCFQTMLEAIQQNDVDSQIELWSQLDELLYYPTEQFLAERSNTEIDHCLTQLLIGYNKKNDGETELDEQDIPQETSDSFIDLIDRYFCAVSPEWTVDFLSRSAEGLCEKYAVASRQFPAQIKQLLNRLAEQPERIFGRLTALRTVHKCLGDTADSIDKWDNVLQAVTEFQWVCEFEWTKKEELIESDQSYQLDQAAEQLIKTTAKLLPRQATHWKPLAISLGARFERTEKPYKKVFAKIEKFIETSVWSTSPIVPITWRRIAITAGSLTGLTAVGLAVNMAIALLFGIGGFLGFGLVFFLAGLWTFFYFAANKIL